MKFGRPKEFREVSFDLTPMIDVVLLLIIFFMLSSQFAQTGRAPMDLPKEQGRPSTPEGQSVVVIDVEGTDRYRLLGETLSLVEVASAVAEQMGGSNDKAQPELVVRAPRMSAAAPLNRLAEALAGAGVRTWKLATEGDGGVGEGGSGGAADTGGGS